MKPLIPHSHGILRTVLFGGLLVVVLGAPAKAGDNDPVGDLPKTEDGSGSSSGEQHGDSAGPDVLDVDDNVVVVHSEAVLGAGHTRAGVLVAWTGGVGGGAKLASPMADQMFATSLDSGAQADLLPPGDVLMAQALLVVDHDDQASLGDVLAGQVTLDAVTTTPLTPSFDLDRFAELAVKLLPVGGHATWIVFTVDSQGVMHRTAARVSSDASPTEVLLD